MKTAYSMSYRVANFICHALHIGIITFVGVGWLIPSQQSAHLILIVSTLACWFVLGLWLGFGYCPITDWHWKLKDRWGDGRPQTSYIHSGLENVLGRLLSRERVDLAVVFGTIAIALAAFIQFFYL